MISGEDESSSGLNGRLRPRKSTAHIPNPPNKLTHKTENKVAQDKPKRNNTPSKASPNKQDDLTSKAESSPPAQLLCPYCDKKFSTKISASKHARRIHLSTSRQDNFINCLFCNHSEAASSEIIRHMVDSHPNQYFACLDCNTRFFSTSELAEHKLNVCEKQKQAYRSKLRQKTSSVSKKDQKKIRTTATQYSRESTELKHEHEFNGLVISCELKPSHGHDAIDIEENITTNLILPSNIGNSLEKNAVIILDDIQWNRSIPPNFSFRNADADQILSRLGVVHRSPRVGETSRREWLKLIDVTSQKFEKCFDTIFYSRVASNVQQNLARFLDGSFNFSPDPDKVIKTRKTKSSAIINTAEGFPILLPHEQYSRNRFDGYMPRALAPKHKWKWDSTENEKNIIFDASVVKRDNHVDNCIITLISSLDIWTQLRMRSRFEGIFCKAATEKFEKQNVIGRELKEILESREIPCSSTQIVEYPQTSSTAEPIVALKEASEFPSFLGLSPRTKSGSGEVQPAVLSGEWVRPRCYVCCACGDQTSDGRALSAHMASHHPNAQVQHYEIVGESLLNADILKHLYVPPSQMPNRTRPIRGFRECTKCKKSVTMEELHQHMLDCAGDTPTVRRKGRSRPFGVRRRRPRLPDNVIRKKMRKDLRTRHNAKALLRARPRIRTEVGDAETIRKMIADLPAKRHRQAAGNLNTPLILRPRRKLEKQRNKLKIKRLTSKDTKTRKVETKNDLDDSSILDEDDQPLKPKTKVELIKTIPTKKRVSSRVQASKCKKLPYTDKNIPSLNDEHQDALNDTADTSHPTSQQMSTESSSQSLNINSYGKNTGEEANRDGIINNDNGGERKKSPDRERGKDNDEHVESNPTPLKHSINSITSSSNSKSQLQLSRSLAQIADETEKTQDTRNINLVNESDSALHDKPPIQTSIKRTSQKKRESLLNCIEKIKSQQKGEAMYDQGPADWLNPPIAVIEHAQFPLMDPHPAVISRSCDESGTVENVVPTRLKDPQHDVVTYTWNPGLQTQCPNDVLVMIPTTESVNNSKMFPEADRTPKKWKLAGQNRQSSVRLTQTELQLPKSICNDKSCENPYYGTLQDNVLTQLEKSRMCTDLLLQQQQMDVALKNQYKNQRLVFARQYASDLHYEGKDRTAMRNETVSRLAGTQLNPNIQRWSRETIQIQQMKNNLAVSCMIPSTAGNDFAARRPSLKRASESSDNTDFFSNRNLDDADLLQYMHLRRLSPETAVVPYVPSLHQGSKETNPYYNSQVPLDISFNKNKNNQDYSHDGHRSKRKRNSESNNAYSLTPELANYYRRSQNQTTAVNNQYYTPRLREEQHLAKSSEKDHHDGSHMYRHEDLLKKGSYNNFDKKLANCLVRNSHSLISMTPTENQITENAYFLKDTTTRNAIQDNTDILLNIQRQSNDLINMNSYIEVADHIETRQNYSDLMEEPLDLSGKPGRAVFNDNTSNVSIDEENNEISYATLDLSKTTSKDSNKITADVYSKLNSCQQITDVNNEYSKIQQTVPCLNQNSDIENSMSSGEVHPYYRQTNESSASNQNKNDNNYTSTEQNSFPKQLFQENEVRNDFNESAGLTNLENIEHSKGAQAANVSTVSTITNICLTQNDQLDKIIEKYTSVCDESMPSCSTSQQCYKMTDRVVQTENIISSENTEQNTSPCEVATTQAQSNNATATPAPGSAVERFPETAKKMELFPPELVDLLNVVPQEQHTKFVSVITLLIPKDKKGKAAATDKEPPAETQNAEQAQLNAAPKDESAALPKDESTINTEIKLTINTALPSSSILPKKRHSPSATSQVSSSTHPTPIDDPKNRSDCIDISNNTINKTFDETLSDIDKIIDLTDDDHDDPLPMPGVPNSNNVIPETSNTSKLRSIRIKPPMSRPSDDKQLMIPNSQQSIDFDSKERSLTANNASPHLEIKNAFINANNDNSAYHSNIQINQSDTQIKTQDTIQIASKPTLNHYQSEQSATNDIESYYMYHNKNSDENKQQSILNDKKHQVFVMPDHKVTEIDVSKDLKNETSLELVHGNIQNISNSIIEQDTVVVSESSTCYASEQIYSTVENGEHLYTEQAHNNLKFEELLNKTPKFSSEPIVNNHATIFEEDSDDDVSLALIVKQKIQENTFTENEDSRPGSDTSDFPVPAKKRRIRSKKASKHLQNENSQLINIYNNFNIVSEKSDDKKDFSVESESDIAIDNMNNVNVDDHNTCGYLNKNKSCTSDESQSTIGDDLLRTETDTAHALQTNSIVNGSELLASQSNLNEKSNAIDPHQFLNEKCSAEENNSSLSCDYPNSISENSVANELQEQQEKIVSKISVPSDVVNTGLMSFSNTTAEVTEVTERALRRSRRGKSLFLNDQNKINSEKIPVAKKQLILSKLLDENNPLVKYGKDSKFELTSETKIKATKRKMSPAKPKNKKKKPNSVSECGFSDMNELGHTDENNKSSTEKELSNTSENYSSDFGSLGLDLDINDENSNTKTQKSVPLITDERLNKKNTKINENISKMDSYLNVNSNDCTKTAGSSQVKINEEIVDYQIPTSAFNVKKQPEKTGTEIRTACYNRPIPHQQITLTSVFDKNPLNYDPYDIDLDMDMVDMSRPIVKRKTNKSVSGKKNKKSVHYENTTDNIQQKIETEIPKITLPDSFPPSDSDSSISDVPLQKYVIEKAKLKIESLKTSCDNNSENNNVPTDSLIERHSDLSEMSRETDNSVPKQNNIEKSDEFGESELTLVNNITSLPVTISDAEKSLDDEGRIKGDVQINIDDNQSVEHIQSSKEQSNETQRKCRKRKISKKSPNLTNEYDQQFLSDMNNLELFAYKTPRKSNLIASKKISETFNKLESEEAYYRPPSKNRQKKSTHNDKKSAVKEHTSKPQDTIVSTRKKSSPAQSTAQQETENENVLNVPCVSSDMEVDLITAQKMLESEEIRKLERDLYSGFKKAAEANAGKTSGFNQLRVEENNQSQSYEEYKPTPIEDHVAINPIELPERPESPERSNSPEGLKDKPLMYPEEEVNIYEDKYDIIKRRREANANAKQFQKDNKPTQCKTGRVKKKPEKKTTKKSYQKKILQASQVPTKAALKNFESVKISIPTQDLHMPPNVSPPHRQKRRRSIKYKQSSGKPRNDSISSYKSDSDTNSKAVGSSDIYEFQDDERPALKGYKMTNAIDNYASSSSDDEDTIIETNRLPKGKQNKKYNNAIRAINEQQTEKTKRKKGRGKRKGKTLGTRGTLNRKQKNQQSAVVGSNDTEPEIHCRFVPDNNEVSSYESDAMPPSPADTTVEDALECSCPTENFNNHEKATRDPENTSEERDTLKGCNSIHCRYKNDNMKNTALENIFRSSCKPEDKENKLNRLFDSLLDGVNSESSAPDSKTTIQSINFFTTEINPPLDAFQTISLREKSCVDDGFNSPDHSDSENKNKNVLGKISLSSNKKNFLDIGDDSPNIDEISNESIENLYALVTRKQSKSSLQTALKLKYSKDTDMEVLKGPDTSNTMDNNNEKTPEDCLANLVKPNKGLKSGNDIKLKYKRGESEGRKKSILKRSAPLSDDESSSSDSDSSPRKISNKKRATKTTHKSHHKNNKTIPERNGSDEQPNSSKATTKATTKTKRNRTSRKSVKEDDLEDEEKQLKVKLSPSRKSDEGISTSHDNSADAYDGALDTGVALQRARRKCTVGKQNVLVEHWSSSDTDDEPSRGKPKKSASVKKSSRAVRKASSSRRSREEVVEVDNSRALVLRSRDLAIPDPQPQAEPDLDSEPKSDESDTERDPKDKSEQELHGWIVGCSHKKLVTMLVCSKRKSNPDDDDDDEVETNLLAIEAPKEEEIETEKEQEGDNKEENEKEHKEEEKKEKEEELDEDREEENENMEMEDDYDN